jgi:hypothetical protein
VRRGRGQRRSHRSTAAKERGRSAVGRRRHGGPWGINGAVRRGVRRSGDGAYWRGQGGIPSLSPAAAGTGRGRERVWRDCVVAAQLVVQLWGPGEAASAGAARVQCASTGVLRRRHRHAWPSWARVVRRLSMSSSTRACIDGCSRVRWRELARWPGLVMKGEKRGGTWPAWPCHASFGSSS